ncbi:nitrate assimilation regulatory protein nirA [Purpureocillium lilacinum]|uniref:Nitrate assimilation regulatory protein nirA n=1 Tax=Purpureocillium lilacinum TaxID=33203 RepID=A0A179HWG2_PURLI|nr:nitrate assimilation regulatory protein nirA [Purpureocillium lilacinum]OAQ93891.1 nitrate assimilation regulatory protein nirA [Purpureocillium lilacinum]
MACDGEDPCERCKEAGLECVFDHSRRESKDDLRAEIERLRRTNERSDALLDALSSMDDADTYHMVAQGLMDGAVSRQSIYNDLPGHLRLVGMPGAVPAAVVASSLRRNSQPASSAGASSTETRPTTCPHCRSALPATSSVADSDECSGRTSDRHPSADPQSETNWLTTPGSGAGSIPSLPSVSGDEKLPPASVNWTRTGWPLAKIKEHLDSLLTWDYLPFCLLCKDPFLQSFASGDGRYCSPALVNSLLALSTRIAHVDEHRRPRSQQHQQEQQDHLVNADGGSPTSGWSDSQALFDEAEALVSSRGQPGSLPDIQALGMLALYQVSCGREAEARELAEAFASAITELCLREPLPTDKPDSQYALVRATTYCGAISLVRILKLLTAQPSGMHTTMMQDDGVALDQPPCAYGAHEPPVLSGESRQWHESEQDRMNHRAWWADGDDIGTLAGEHRSQLSSLQLIPAKIFQLTEWVYKLLASPQTAAGDEVVLVYHRCLDWYESFFAMLKTDGSNSPFVLFIHMYYQFCLLSICRPYVSMPLEGLNAHPREICLQTAQSILGLAQSYAGVFGLHRVSPLVPYFVCAAGLLSLAVEEAGHGVLGAVPMPHGVDPRAGAVGKTAKSPEDAIKKEPGDDAMDVDTHHHPRPRGDRHDRRLAQPSHVNMPAVAHARLLLSEMSAVHPAATLAEVMLHRAPGRN